MHETLNSVSGLAERLRDFYFFWLNAHDAGQLPRLSRLDLHRVDSTLDRLVVTEILHGPDAAPRDFQFIYIGRTISGAMARDLTGHCISEDPDRGPGSRMWSAYADIARTPRPLLVSLPYVGPDPAIIGTQELFLPLNDDHRVTRFVLIGIEFLRSRPTARQEHRNSGTGLPSSNTQAH